MKLMKTRALARRAISRSASRHAELVAVIWVPLKGRPRSGGGTWVGPNAMPTCWGGLEEPPGKGHRVEGGGVGVPESDGGGRIESGGGGVVESGVGGVVESGGGGTTESEPGGGTESTGADVESTGDGVSEAIAGGPSAHPWQSMVKTSQTAGGQIVPWTCDTFPIRASDHCGVRDRASAAQCNFLHLRRLSRSQGASSSREAAPPWRFGWTTSH